jgi:LPS export ABC transporter protein LptC
MNALLTTIWKAWAAKKMGRLSCCALLFVLIFVACSQESLNQKSGVLEQGVADETSQRVRLIEYKNDRVDYVIEAENMERFTDRRMLYGYKVTLSAYGKDGMISSVIKADTTIVDDARNIVFANGNVIFTTPEGEIRTQKMFWERSLDEITVPVALTLTRQGDVMTGSNMRTNTKLSYVEMDAVAAEGYFDEKEFLDW